MSYVINHFESGPPSCLPEYVDRYRYRLVDVTAIGDSWRKYLDTETGTIHDGAEYFVKANAGPAGEDQPTASD